MPTLIRTSLVLGLTLVTAGSGAAPATAPAVNSTAAVALGPGRLDPTLARGASTFNGVHEMKRRISAEGQVEKLAVYHRDAAAVPDTQKGPSRDAFSLEVEHGGRVHDLRVGPEGAVLAHHLRIPAEVDVPML